MSDVPTITFPLTRVEEFKRQYRKDSGLRVGQAFYVFMELEKIVQNKAFAETLYQADGEKAWAMIFSATDHQN